MSAHTPGPWVISASAREYNNELMITAPEAGDNGVHVCQVTTDGKGNKKSVTPEQDANARLIAAAPELLNEVVALQVTNRELRNALQEAADALIDKDGRVRGWGIVINDSLKRWRLTADVIAKATGGAA